MASAIHWGNLSLYRIHRIKDSQKEDFRWSAHTGGLAIVKARDYEAGGEVRSESPYALWKELQDTTSPHGERALSPGDLLETAEIDGAVRLLITKYIGFEPAQWFVPELKESAALADKITHSEIASERVLQS